MRELNCDISDISRPLEHGINYDTLIISNNKLAIIAVVFDGSIDTTLDSITPLANGKVYVDGKYAATTDSNGYFDDGEIDIHK